MSFKLKFNRGVSSDILDDTNNNVVIKFDSESVKRMHNLSLAEARVKYIKMLKNLTNTSS